MSQTWVFIQLIKKLLGPARDMIRCPEVWDAPAKYKPDVVIANAGAARLLLGGRITMYGYDIDKNERFSLNVSMARKRPEILRQIGYRYDSPGNII
jgi:hypothetical protein